MTSLVSPTGTTALMGSVVISTLIHSLIQRTHPWKIISSLIYHKPAEQLLLLRILRMLISGNFPTSVPLNPLNFHLEQRTAKHKRRTFHLFTSRQDQLFHWDVHASTARMRSANVTAKNRAINALDLLFQGRAIISTHLGLCDLT